MSPTTVNSSLGVSVPIPTIPEPTNNVVSPPEPPAISKPPAAAIVPEAEISPVTVKPPERSPPVRLRKFVSTYVVRFSIDPSSVVTSESILESSVEETEVIVEVKELSSSSDADERLTMLLLI